MEKALRLNKKICTEIAAIFALLSYKMITVQILNKHVGMEFRYKKPITRQTIQQNDGEKEFFINR